MTDSMSTDWKPKLTVDINETTVTEDEPKHTSQHQGRSYTHHSKYVGSRRSDSSRGTTLALISTGIMAVGILCEIICFYRKSN